MQTEPTPLPLELPKPEAQTVVLISPNGRRIEVYATREALALWVARGWKVDSANVGNYGENAL